jgi:hypothetical protein
VPRSRPGALGAAIALAAITRETFSMICPLEAAAGLVAGGREAGYRRDYQIRSED